MNDESNTPKGTDESTFQAHDPPLPQDEAAEEIAGEPAPPKEPPLDAGTDPATEMPADPDADPDPDCQGADPAPEADGLDELRGELKRLREELNERDAKLRRLARIDREFEEFSSLYPEVAISEIPEEIWSSVEQGNSLAAAYALAQHRLALQAKQAQQANASNRARSAGAFSNAENLEYSPSEVRAMSAREVRENLPKIMRSMQKWK